MPQRNEQFEKIAQLRASYHAAGNPVISMDTKKKEYIGNFYRSGHLYTTAPVQAWDHDFVSLAEGRIIPHGIYDLALNKGFLTLGTSHDTAEFATDSLRAWWHQIGQHDYPQATSMLLLCDGGGSNHVRHFVFKQAIQELANELGVEIRIAHYPPYCSKFNPIEHRLFPHVTRACRGVLFKSVAVVKELMTRTKTQQGLQVTVHLLDKLYQTGRKAMAAFIENMPILFDDFLPAWNYRAVPQLP